MFCMLLRKHLEGGIVHRVKQVEMDRIVHVDIRTRNELGDEVIRVWWWKSWAATAM